MSPFGPRQVGGATSETTLDSGGFEIRRVVIVQGVQFTNRHFEEWAAHCASRRDEYDAAATVAEGLGEPGNARRARQRARQWDEGRRRALLMRVPTPGPRLLDRVDLTDRGAGSQFRYEYRCTQQEVTYRIRVVNEKDELKQWLETETPPVHVIYGGHSRYGRGTCFGTTTDPGEHWGDGTGAATGTPSTDDGIFRLGFDIVGVPISDIHHHDYTTSPVRGASVTIDRRTSHPDVVRAVPMRRVVIDSGLDTSRITGSRFDATAEDWGWWQWDSGDQCIRVRPKADFNLAGHLRGGTSGGSLWGFRHRKGGAWELELLLEVGWNNTAVRPWDLGSTDLKCRVFCHFGCSALQHFRPIIRGADHKNWQRTGTGRAEHNFAYFTTAPAPLISVPVWLCWLFRYPHRNKNRSWGPSLEWAKVRATREIRYRWGYAYSIV